MTDAINKNISRGVFPVNAKNASVFLIDQNSDDKHEVSNFRPVSVLSTFLKYMNLSKKKSVYFDFK